MLLEGFTSGFDKNSVSSLKKYFLFVFVLVSIFSCFIQLRSLFHLLRKSVTSLKKIVSEPGETRNEVVGGGITVFNSKQCQTLTHTHNREEMKLSL